MIRISKIGLLAATAVLALTAGCHDSGHEVRRDGFVPDDQPRQLRNLINQQEAVGARKDGTLHACHFDSAGLNSLGTEKLDLMLSAEEPAAPLVVYLDIPDQQKMPNAHEAVAEYLKSCGLLENQLIVKDGPNPYAGYSAADASVSLRALTAGTGPAAAGGAAPAAGAGGYAPSAMGATGSK
jgi:hypothetical protein